MAKIIDETPARPRMSGSTSSSADTQGSQAWNSIFRPAHPVKGYTDSPQPQLRRHELGAVPPAPGECGASRGEGELHVILGGLSFFLFIPLTVTGIFLMFFLPS
ncbi:MAG: hypothetical protein R2713_22075 [Ilumatobacteraceae bacterium]